ncbi:MAG: M24 family metallopeptidase [Candidatus Micrarchaeia archaeon]
MNGVIRKRLSRLFNDAEFDAVLISNSGPGEIDPDFVYLSGLKRGVYESNMVVATKERRFVFTTPLDYDDCVSQLGSKADVIDMSANGAKNDLVSLLEGKVVGINGSYLPYSEYRRIKREYKIKSLVDVSGKLLEARLVKDKTEIMSMKRAIGITKKAMKEIISHVKQGMTELELAGIFEEILHRNGADGTSFKTIVAFGKNSAIPHHMPDSTRFKHGDVVLIDAGATYEFYCADMTRTFLTSKKDEGIKKIYDTVAEAQRRAISMMRVGEKGGNVDKAARDYIDSVYEGKYKGRFTHSLGHSVGIEVHDGYVLSPKSNVVLKEGMVFTAEPGVYVPGLGGVRIEDDILITKNGPIKM